MPQSRHRKSGKARKRPKGTYQTANPSPSGKSNQTTRVITILVVVILLVSAGLYLFSRRGPASGAEIATGSGLKYVDLVEGTGASPQPGQMVSVHYRGTLENGTEFDSSYRRGKPMDFRYVAQPMIKGWDEGLKTMKPGGKRKLIVPPSLGYGSQDKDGIPPNSTLIFEVELLSVK